MSPILVQSTLPRISPPVRMQGAYFQPSIGVPAVTQYPMTSFTSVPSSIDTIQASANFPPEDTCLLHTHASYSKQPIPELAKNVCGNWTLTLEVPIPGEIIHPTLTSLTYTVKYSTANDHCASVVQSHVLLTVPGSEANPVGISVHSDTNGNSRDWIAVVPQTFESTSPTCLLSVHGVKQNDTQGQWSHFVDCQQIPLNVRIVQSSWMCFQLSVSEHPTITMLRSLSVDVTATWQEDQEGRRLIGELDDAEKVARDAEEEAATEEAARKKMEAQQAAEERAERVAEVNQQTAERQSAIDAKARRVAEEQVNRAKSERQTAEANADAEKRAREEAERKEQSKPKVADAKEQARIERALHNLPENRKCPAGYGWVKEGGGYRCTGGSHYITQAELDSAGH